MKYIFGPLPSRRFGQSLGVDLSRETKRCNYDCLYCELDKAKPVNTNTTKIDIAILVDEVKQALVASTPIDVITVTANGEPTLHTQLDEIINALNPIKHHTKTLILTNTSTINDPPIQTILHKFDIVKCSMDAITPAIFRKIDRPHKEVDIVAIQQALLTFKATYKGVLILEILFVKGINDTPEEVQKIASYAKALSPSRVDLNSVDRAPAYDVKPLSHDELIAIAKQFDPELNVKIFSQHREAHIAVTSGHKQYY